MTARQKYEDSGGLVALIFILGFFALVGLMGYAGAQQQAAMRSQCADKGGDLIWRPHGNSLCVPKGQVIILTEKM